MGFQKTLNPIKYTCKYILEPLNHPCTHIFNPFKTHQIYI